MTNHHLKIMIDYAVSRKGIFVFCYIDVAGRIYSGGDKPNDQLSIWTLTETLRGSLTVDNSIFISTVDNNFLDNPLSKRFDVTIHCS
jgi:hypothetical protein